MQTNQKMERSFLFSLFMLFFSAVSYALTDGTLEEGRVKNATSMASHAPGQEESELKVGEKFPGTFTLHDIDDGEWTEKSLEGKVVVINCWYSWCGACRREMKELSEWKTEFPSVLFLSANFEEKDKVRTVAEKEGFTWTHLYEARFFVKWVGDKGFPLTIVIDKDGIVRNVTHGTNKEKRAVIHALVSKLAGEQVTGEAQTAVSDVPSR